VQSWQPRTGADLPSLARAGDLLAQGAAVVVPNPPPMTYGVVATTARMINTVKCRAPSQNVAISVHDQSEWRRMLPIIDLQAAALEGVVTLLRRRLTLLLPVRPDLPTPPWIAPAVRAGQLAAFNGWWAPTAPIWERFPRLYGSSANRTGEPPATSAAQARRTFGRDCFVVDAESIIDADALGSQSKRSAPSTMMRLDRDGRLSLHRSGAQDQHWAPRPEAFLRNLAELGGLPVAGDEGQRRPRQRCVRSDQ
jgi:tRNA A37 threonylcarbamoyladenosine synthetase subunit TsaC/SUA5/YrdC